jgi:muramoyltetrapeptide carboxypeptidase
MTPRTRAGLRRCRRVQPGSRIALVAPASPFAREEFDAGVAELTRLGFVPVYDAHVFDREPIVAGPAAQRAASLMEALTAGDVDAVVAIRGGYGSVETLGHLDAARLAERRTAFVGYSDVTSLHTFINQRAGLTSVYGAMVERRIARGPAGYDVPSFLASLSADPLGEIAIDGGEVLRPGEVEGPLFGGTLTQLVASLGTPYAFDPPSGHVLLIEDVGERPYRLRRMLVQLASSGRLAQAAAVVIGDLPNCDEGPDRMTGRQVMAEFFADFPGPVVAGLPTGHTTRPTLSVPLGVSVRVVGDSRPRLIFEEAAAA